MPGTQQHKLFGFLFNWMRAVIILVCGAIAGLTALAIFSVTAPSDRALLFVLAGQSNMSGRGDVRKLPVAFPENGTRLYNFNNAYQWQKAREPIDASEGQLDLVSADNAGVGPGLAFANALANAIPERPIGLIPCAKGATSISDWLVVAGRSSLLGSCLNRIREASKFGTVAGVLWYQGESDTESRQQVEQWPTRFTQVVQIFRNAIPDATDLPIIAVVIGDLGAQRLTDPRFRYWSELQSRQRTTAIDGVYWVEANQFELDPADGLHLSTKGQLALGAAMAKAMCRKSIVRQSQTSSIRP